MLKTAAADFSASCSNKTMWFENQLPYFLWMTACGAGIMFAYDFLRISRRLLCTPTVIVNLEDILFAAISAVLVFYVTYLKNNGEIRWQTLIGLAVGCVSYIILIKDRFVRAICAVWGFISGAVKKILLILLRPIAVILRILLKPARLVMWYSGRGVRKIGRTAKIRSAKAKIGLKKIGFIMRKK